MEEAFSIRHITQGQTHVMIEFIFRKCLTLFFYFILLCYNCQVPLSEMQLSIPLTHFQRSYLRLVIRYDSVSLNCFVIFDFLMF